jgi:hypothetical protein
MRSFLTGMIFLAAAGAYAPASAEVIYPWCAYYAGKTGGHNCGFATLQQCHWAISGNGGFCSANPLYAPPVVAHRYRR